MSRVADGATTRRERLLDMLTYIQGFEPSGVGSNEVCLHMSLAHGLTRRRTLEYLYEMQLAGVITQDAGKIRIKETQFKRLMELLERDVRRGGLGR